MIPIKELIGLLDENIHLYERMAQSCVEERAFVESGEIEKLERVTEEKENITFRLKAVDEKRRGVLAKISNDLGLSSQPMTLRDIARRAEYRSVKGKILDIRRKLNSALLEVQKLSRFNARLLGSSVSVIKRTMTDVLRPESEPITYLGAKIVENHSGRGSMLRRAL